MKINSLKKLGKGRK